MIEPYAIACVQADVYPYYTGESMEPHPENLERNLSRACELVSYHARSGAAGLYLFSEFSLTGSPAGSPAEVYRAQSIRIPGPEIAELAAVARRRRVYIAGQAYEIDDEWPDRFFNTSFILDPDGRVALKYRKHYDNTCKTKPGDVWDEYIARHGVESLFPTVDTELGRLGCMTAYEINYPEIARCLVMNGAEVLLHMTSETRSWGTMHRTGGWDMCRATRAYENVAYLASTNEAWFRGSVRPSTPMHGHSQIIDYRGRLVNYADTDAETIITGEIDIEALRRQRTAVRGNLLAQVQPHLYARVLREKADLLWPKNAWLHEPARSAKQNNQIVQDVAARMREAGIYAEPTGFRARAGEHWM